MRSRAAEDGAPFADTPARRVDMPGALPSLCVASPTGDQDEVEGCCCRRRGRRGVRRCCGGPGSARGRRGRHVQRASGPHHRDVAAVRGRGQAGRRRHAGRPRRRDRPLRGRRSAGRGRRALSRQGRAVPHLLHDQADHGSGGDDPVRGGQVSALRPGQQVRPRVREPDRPRRQRRHRPRPRTR